MDRPEITTSNTAITARARTVLDIKDSPRRTEDNVGVVRPDLAPDSYRERSEGEDVGAGGVEVVVDFGQCDLQKLIGEAANGERLLAKASVTLETARSAIDRIRTPLSFSPTTRLAKR